MESVMRLIFCLICSLIVLFVGNSGATSIRTPIQSASANLMRAIKMYAQSHDGEIPSNWSDLDAFLRSKEHPSSWGSDGRSFFFGEMERLLGEKVEEKFLLVADSGIAMAGRDGSSRFDSGTVIVVSASPIGEDRRDEAGRYVIWQKKSGEILSAWIGESLIQNQFREAGATLKTGPIAVQPPTIDKEFDRLVKEYAEANFTNPENPTKKELQDLEDYVADKYKEENSDYDSAESAATESSRAILCLQRARVLNLHLCTIKRRRTTMTTEG